MKKTFAAIMAILAFSATVFAQTQNDLVTKIAAKASRNINHSFTEERTAVGASKPTALDGTLVFKPQGYLSMDYSNGDLFVIDGDKMTIKRAGREQVFDTSKNLMMQGLSHMLIYAFQGKVDDLAKERDADIMAYQENGLYIVTLTARKKSARGYSRAIFRYDASTCAIKSMKLEEFSGQVTSYAL